MDIQWSELLAGFALAMVFEGLLPFLSPRHFRLSLVKIIQLGDSGARLLGFISMELGLVMLYLARH